MSASDTSTHTTPESSPGTAAGLARQFYNRPAAPVLNLTRAVILQWVTASSISGIRTCSRVVTAPSKSRSIISLPLRQVESTATDFTIIS